jgi:hypothetical protein
MKQFVDLIELQDGAEAATGARLRELLRRKNTEI